MIDRSDLEDLRATIETVADQCEDPSTDRLAQALDEALIAIHDYQRAKRKRVLIEPSQPVIPLMDELPEPNLNL